jgi:hypothetical protein
MSVLGLDVGGANLKAGIPPAVAVRCRFRSGRTRTAWRQRRQLTDGLPPYDRPL